MNDSDFFNYPTCFNLFITHYLFTDFEFLNTYKSEQYIYSRYI